MRTATSPTLKRIGALTAGSALLVYCDDRRLPRWSSECRDQPGLSYTGHSRRTPPAVESRSSPLLLKVHKVLRVARLVAQAESHRERSTSVGQPRWTSGLVARAQAQPAASTAAAMAVPGANSGGGGGGASDVRVADAASSSLPGGGGGGGDAGKKNQLATAETVTRAGTAGSAGTNNDKGVTETAARQPTCQVATVALACPAKSPGRIQGRRRWWRRRRSLAAQAVAAVLAERCHPVAVAVPDRVTPMSPAASATRPTVAAPPATER